MYDEKFYISWLETIPVLWTNLGIFIYLFMYFSMSAIYNGITWSNVTMKATPFLDAWILWYEVSCIIFFVAMEFTTAKVKYFISCKYLICILNNWRYFQFFDAQVASDTLVYIYNIILNMVKLPCRSEVLIRLLLYHLCWSWVFMLLARYYIDKKNTRNFKISSM